MMVLRSAFSCGFAAALLLTAALATTANAQQPSATSLATAQEIVKIKGAVTLFSPVITGVVEQAKLTFLQTNPNLQKDLNEVANSMRSELAPRMQQVNDEIAKLYTSHFTEAELKDVLAFYKSPLGVKMNQEEPKFVDQSMSFVQTWANKLSEEVIVKFRAEMKKRGHEI